MDDRSLLEFAAKAVDYWNYAFDCYQGPPDWNPIYYDEDAFQLAVYLRLDINHYPESGEVGCVQHCKGKTVNRIFEKYSNSEPIKATRLAIVKCAAEIGKKVKS